MTAFRSEATQGVWGIRPPVNQIFRHEKRPASPVFFRASGGNRTRTAFSGQGIFVPLWLSPPKMFVVWTIPSPWVCPLGVPCLVSAPSSYWRLGSRLPSALSVKVSLNLRHSTSLFSESALKKFKSLVSTIPPPRRGLGMQRYEFFFDGEIIMRRGA